MTLDAPAAQEVHIHLWQDRRKQRGDELLASAVARYTTPPTITRSQSGKLLLSTPDWHASVSHKAQYAVVAIATTGPIGIDLELLQTRRFAALAAYAFHPIEAEAITASDDPGHLFYETWTRKEALAKQIDAPLAQVLRSDLRCANCRFTARDYPGDRIVTLASPAASSPVPKWIEINYD